MPVPCTRVRTHTPVRAATPTSGQLGGVGLWDLGIPQGRPLCWPHALASGGGRDSRCEGEGCSAWVTRVGRVVPLTAAPQSSLWGELPWAQWESTPVDSSVTLTCSDVPRRTGAGGGAFPLEGRSQNPSQRLRRPRSAFPPSPHAICCFLSPAPSHGLSRRRSASCPSLLQAWRAHPLPRFCWGPGGEPQEAPRPAGPALTAHCPLHLRAGWLGALCIRLQEAFRLLPKHW